MLLALGALILRTLVPCHDAAASGAASVDALISGVLCSSGQLTTQSGDLPGAPTADPAPVCLHCATGCSTGTAAMASAWLLALLAVGRPLRPVGDSLTARLPTAWPGVLARGPPALA
jgi:hypothetical protein